MGLRLLIKTFLTTSLICIYYFPFVEVNIPDMCFLGVIGSTLLYCCGIPILGELNAHELFHCCNLRVVI